MSDAILYTGQNDYDSVVLRWLVREKNAPVDVRRLGALAMHTVVPPYMVDRDLQLFDHWVILQYMQERYPGEQLMPVDPQVRAQIRQICTLVRRDEVTEDELNKVLCHKQPYLLGTSFTLADVYAGVRLSRMRLMRTYTKKYVDRLEGRLAYMEAQ